MPFIAVLMYALMVTPVVVYARFDVGSVSSVKARVRIWRFSMRFDAVLRRGKNGPYFAVREKRAGRESGEVDVGVGSAARAFLKNRRARRYILTRIRLYELTARVQLGTGDAAYTAWACGALNALLFPLSRVVERTQGVRPRFDVRCDWAQETFVMSAHCIIALLPGDIMAALLLAAARKLRKEARKRWTGTPLKA